MRTDDFVQFIIARHSIFLARQRMQPKPWTENQILQRYRFCNVYRELDAVTQWITQNWREPLSKSGDPNLWFWMLVARLVNHPDTLLRLQARMRHDETGEWKWKPDQFISTIESAQLHGRKAWGGAYIVSTNGRQMPKALYIATDVLGPAWKHRKDVQPRQHDTLASFCARLMSLNGVQGFVSGQVIADAKYGDEDLAAADDWHTFAISGPGSRRGLNRVLNSSVNEAWRKEERWHRYLLLLREETNAALAKLRKKNRPADYPPLHAQDVQNCLCEFDKYERVRLGEGKPRSTYPGV